MLFLNYLHGLAKRASKGLEAGRKLVNAAVDAVKSLPSKMATFGKNVVQGFWNGITALGGWLKDKVKGFFNGVVDGVKSALKINSPSKLFEQFGKWTDQGFINGIDAYAGKTKKAMSNMINGAVSVFDPNALQFNTPSIGQLQNGLSGVNTNVNSRVDHIVSDNLNNGGTQPAEINLNIGGKVYRAFVDDISNAQNAQTQLTETYL